MKKIDKLPDTLYVTQEHEDWEACWFNAKEDISLLAQADRVTEVGVYKLVEVKRITLKVAEEVVEES